MFVCSKLIVFLSVNISDLICLWGIGLILQHVEVPIPTPKNDEVLLKLEAIGLNPADWKVQKGMLRPLLPRKFPYIPGNLSPNTSS